MKKICLALVAVSLTAKCFCQTFTNTTGGAITDNNAYTSFPIIVAGLPSTLNTLNFGLESVTINVNHTNDADLRMKLQAPDGTLIILTSFSGGTGDNYTATVFTDTSSVLTASNSAPFTGFFRPIDPLANANNGQNGNGMWQLNIRDQTTGETGNVVSWSINFSNQPAGAISFTSSNLPIVVINTNSQTILNGTKITADMGIIYNGPGVRNYLTDPKNNYNGKIGIEIRGQSSVGFPQKQYNVETRDSLGNNLDVSILGLAPENDWVLYAPYNDKTLMRNVITYQLARDMGRWAANTRFCEVTINSEYRGVYVFMEKIKRDSLRVNLKKMYPTYNAGDSLTGGYIFNIDKDAPTWQSAIAPNNASGQQIGFTIQYPDLADVTPQQSSYIKSYVDGFETALNSAYYQDPLTGYRKYAVVKSFVDFFIINELTRNVDGYRLSTYLNKNRDSKGGQIKAGPVWDFNLALKNANYCNGSNITGWCYQFNSVCGGDSWVVPFWWDKLVTDSAFSNKLYCTYTNLRTNLLDTAVLFSKIDSMAAEVDEAKTRHFKKWPILGVYVWPNPTPYPTSFAEEIRVMKDWVYQRLLWLDANMYGAGPCVAQITTGGAAAQLTQNIDALIYPNPFVNEIRLELNVFKPDYIQISLLNAQGKLITTLTEDYFEKDEFGFTWNFNKLNLHPGLYFLQVKGEHTLKNFRIIKEQ